jgi:hypothetical protein
LAQTDADLLPSRNLVFNPMPLVAEPRLIVLSDERLQEIDDWTRDFTAWQTWAARWTNRRQPGKWAYVVDRQQKPDPPVWLEDACAFADGDTRLTHACDLLVSWHDDLTTGKIRRTVVDARAEQEAPSRSVWWQHLHIDGAWSTTQSNAMTFALVGAHYTIDVEGRLQIFAAPGMLVVSVPSLSGSRELWPATDWGASYRLFNVGRSTVHFNLVHAWILGSGASSLLNPNITLAGFSFTFRPR